MGVQANAVAAVLGIDVNFKNLRSGSVPYVPQRVALLAQGSTSATYGTAKFQATSASQVGEVMGHGSPAHLSMLELFPIYRRGMGAIPVTVYPLEEDGDATPAEGSIEPVGTAEENGTIRVKASNIPTQRITIESGDEAAQIIPKIIEAAAGNLAFPMTVDDGTTTADFTSKWAGDTANDLELEVEGSVEGLDWTFTQPTGGATNPTVDAALAEMGDVWETLLINTLGIDDTTALDTIQAHGDGRWTQNRPHPYVSFVGNTATSVASSVTTPDERPSDKVNAQIPNPGSNDLPFVVAAAGVAEIAKIANDNPARDYQIGRLHNLTPGSDSDQWTWAERQQAVTSGSSTTEVIDGVVRLADVVTFYHPEGDPEPPYRHVVDIVKLQQVLFNIDLIFSADEWKGAPLIPDNQATKNPTAKKPRMARSDAAEMIDALAFDAILADPKATKKAITADISGTNSKRLDIAIPVKVAGNTNVRSVDLNWGFNYGIAAA